MSPDDVREAKVYRCDDGNAFKSWKYLNVGLLQVMGPSREQILSHLLLKVASICNESCRQQTVSSDGGHLVFEGFTGLLPTVPFSRQALQQGCAAIHLRGKKASLKRPLYLFEGREKRNQNIT